MFDKILIANRGEIACRVIRTAKRLGIKTVTVYSEADAGALHVRDADEAVAIGAAPAADSYLQADRIIAAAKETGAQAIHPGFGFLSENESFCQALEDEGLVFIGPGRKAIAAMGDKIASKRLAADAGVNVVPGRVDPLGDAEEAADFAEEIGYPVMLKASAGGGGKGMRIARSREEVFDGFKSAASEAMSSFGDERLFVEKFIERPRHIEIQVLADAHGNVLHLGERECSIQRRHQKVIEEAPSPFVDDTLRAEMGAQAVALAKAVDYRSAGTVEFIVDPNGHFFFLEMNTRLQVEHPVTELVTGLDLVEQMIRVAAGEKLGFSQTDIQMAGWAVEARLYAEDPVRGYLPSVGQLRTLRWFGDDGIRIDTGVAEGDEVSIHYDPMIAKVIAKGADREDATDKLIEALDGTRIEGLSHNAGMLTAVLDHPRFRSGELSTAFLDEEYGGGFAPAVPEGDQLYALLAVLVSVHRRRQERERAIGIWAMGKPRPVEFVIVRIGQRTTEARIDPAFAGSRIEIGQNAFVVTESDAVSWPLAGGVIDAQVNGRRLVAQIDPVGAGYRIRHRGADLRALVLEPHVARLAELMPEKVGGGSDKHLLSPMPGLLVSVAVDVGDKVSAGQELAVIEAMKMENVLRAERDGVIAGLKASPGDSLSPDQVILEFE